MYNFLKNNYGLASKIMSVVIFVGTFALVTANLLSLLVVNIASHDDFSNYICGILTFGINIITILTGMAVFLYTLERKIKKPYKKVYLILTIILVVLFSVSYSPILIVGNACIRLMDWFARIPQVIKREKWYLLLIFVSIISTFIVSVHMSLDAKEIILFFISIYLALGLCFCVVPYLLFYSEEKRYFSDFLNHSLYILFSTSFVLTLFKYTIGIDNNDNILLVILNLTTILVAWKRVKDYAKNDSILKSFKNKQMFETDVN